MWKLLYRVFTAFPRMGLLPLKPAELLLSHTSADRRSAQHPETVAQILNEILEPSDSTGVATFFFRALNSA
jgi:hypothetical protein